MRKWPIIWGFSLFASAVAYTLVVLIQIPSCPKRYDEIVQKMSFSGPEKEQLVQKRDHVTKQLIVDDQGQRMHHTLVCDESSFELVNGTQDVIENCYGVVGCYEQLKGCHRLMSAKETTLFWKREKVVSLDVELTQYEDDKPLHWGHADQLEATSDMVVEAEKFTGTTVRGWHVEANRGVIFNEEGFLEGEISLYSDEGVHVSCHALGYDGKDKLSLRSLMDGPLVHVKIPHGKELYEIYCKKLQIPLNQKEISPLVATKEVLIQLEKLGEVRADSAKLYWKKEKGRYCPLKLECFSGQAPVSGTLHDTEERLDFSCDELIATVGEPMEVEMKGRSVINRGWASYFCEGPVNFEIDKGKKAPLYISSLGHSLFHWNPPSKESLSLEWKGMMHFQRENNLLTLEDSICLTHSVGQVLADYAKIHFTEAQMCDEVLLEGQVYLSHHLKVSGPHKLEPLQYALGSRLLYLPEKKELTLSANEGERTLLFDNTNGIEMSAPEVIVCLGEKNEIDKVQGNGDVRFKFNSKERSLLWTRQKNALTSK